MINATFHCDGYREDEPGVRCDTSVTVESWDGHSLPRGWQAVIQSRATTIKASFNHAGARTHYCPFHQEKIPC